MGLNAASLAANDLGETKQVQQVPPAPAATEQRASVKEIIRITKLETFLVNPRWLFLKIHANAEITGLGESITEGSALTRVQAVTMLSA